MDVRAATQRWLRRVKKQTICECCGKRGVRLYGEYALCSECVDVLAWILKACEEPRTEEQLEQAFKVQKGVS